VRRRFSFCAHILLLLFFSNFSTVFYFYFFCAYVFVIEIEDCFEPSSAATNFYFFFEKRLKICQKEHKLGPKLLMLKIILVIMKRYDDLCFSK